MAATVLLQIKLNMQQRVRVSIDKTQKLLKTYVTACYTTSEQRVTKLILKNPAPLAVLGSHAEWH